MTEKFHQVRWRLRSTISRKISTNFNDSRGPSGPMEILYPDRFADLKIFISWHIILFCICSCDASIFSKKQNWNYISREKIKFLRKKILEQKNFNNNKNPLIKTFWREKNFRSFVSFFCQNNIYKQTAERSWKGVKKHWNDGS